MKSQRRVIGDLEISASKEGYPPVIIISKGENSLQLRGEEEIEDAIYALNRARRFVLDKAP